MKNNKNELLNFIDYNPKKFIFIPNEMLVDFRKFKYTTNSHYAFAVCYYILISYFYYVAYYGIKQITQQDIKEILGYSKNYKPIDYLIKKNGLLDKSGYTETTSNYPISVDFDTIVEKGYIEFTMSDEYKELKYKSESNNYKIKYPFKAFFRTKKDYKDGEQTGTFTYYENTTKITSSEFFEIINNKNLGCTGFLIYLYIKQNNSVCMGYDNLSKILMISSRDIQQKVNILEQYGFINITRAYRSSKNTDSNMYCTNHKHTSIEITA